MEALLEPRAIGDITGEFFVPAYQRGYRWGNDEVRRLLSDIWESDGHPYYLQPVVVKSMPDNRWELVDGQQRLTTLYLIFKFMEDEGLQASGASYTLEFETRPESQAFLQAPNAEQSEDNIDFHHIYSAYEQIREWFDDKGHRKQWAANKLYGYLFDAVQVIWYEAPDEPEFDSIELFTRLNVGRIPLTDAELVKALVLTRSSQLPIISNKSEQIAAQWDSIERDLRNPELWSFVTGKHESEATHISLILDTLADRTVGPPSWKTRPRYFTFEALRGAIDDDPQSFWDDVVKLHGLVVGWFEDRDLFHKVGYLVASGESFAELVEWTSGLTRRELHESLDSRIRNQLKLTAEELAGLEYDSNPGKCEKALLLMNVETVRKRAESTEKYSFRAHAKGAWSLEHIHAQNAQRLKNDSKIWAQWLRLHRSALVNLEESDDGSSDLLNRVDELLNFISQGGQGAKEAVFNTIKEEVEVRLSDSSAGPEMSIHSISNLALLDSGDNSALSNSVFEVKRQEILKRDKSGSYIPACTRNVFLKYYTESSAEQIHFWSIADREAYMRAMLETVEPYLLPDEDLA